MGCAQGRGSACSVSSGGFKGGVAERGGAQNGTPSSPLRGGQDLHQRGYGACPPEGNTSNEGPEVPSDSASRLSSSRQSGPTYQAQTSVALPFLSPSVFPATQPMTTGRTQDAAPSGQGEGQVTRSAVKTEKRQLVRKSKGRWTKHEVSSFFLFFFFAFFLSVQSGERWHYNRVLFTRVRVRDRVCNHVALCKQQLHSTLAPCETVKFDRLRNGKMFGVDVSPVLLLEGKSNEISLSVPHNTEHDLPCVLWQDNTLREAVKQYGAKNWKQIAECVPGRTDVQCLHRFACLDSVTSVAFLLTHYAKMAKGAQPRARERPLDEGRG